jgi:uncharacterized protein YbjT (DUF2867 family)
MDMASSEDLLEKPTESLRVLVAGATGQQGGGVARLLARRGHRVRGLTRKPDGPAAKSLRQEGVEVVAGDYEAPRSVEAAAKGSDVAFIVATPFEKGTGAETKGAVAAMDAARAAGVPYLVYSSVSDADRKTGIPHFDSKAEAEQHLQGMGVDYSIVAPVFFMENFTSPWMGAGLAKGVVAMSLPGDRKLQSVSVRDVARYSALAIEQRTTFRGKRVNIAGDELSPIEMASRLSAANDRKISFQEVPLDVMRKQSDDAAKMFEWFNRVGYSADIPRLKRDYPTVGWLAFDAWARSQDWKKVFDGLARPPS